MGKVLLMASSNAGYIPAEALNGIVGLVSQGHELIMVDNKTNSNLWHMTLSRLGIISKVTIYNVGNILYNKFDAKEKVFVTTYDADTKTAKIVDNETGTEEVVESGVELEDFIASKEFTEFKIKKLIKDCDIAICVWDGENKTVFKYIQLLGIHNKPCYSYLVKQWRKQ